MNKIKLLAMMAAAVVVAGCATANPPPDQASIGYTGGPIQGVHYREVFQPGSGLHWMGVLDGAYEYPTTVRTYIVSRQEGEGDRANVDHIDATTKDGVTVAWELAATFKLNTSRLRAFHEQIGLSRHAWFEGGNPTNGWDTMLNDFFRQQLEGALQGVSREMTADQIAKDPQAFRKVSDALGASLKDRVNRSAGGDFFCGAGFSGPVAENDQTVACPDMAVTVKAAVLPANIVDSYAAQKVAENAKITAENNGAAEVAAATKRKEAAQQIADLYRDPNYVAFVQAQAMGDCAKNSNCTLVVTPGGAGVNVNTGGR